MIRQARQQLAGWGNVPCQEVRAFRPESVGELHRTLDENAAETFISRGLGRSYGDASLNRNGGVIRFERLNRFLAWDASRGVVECEAGVTFEDLLRHFVPRGFFPSVTPGTKQVTIGGAIAADVHGKNHHRDGSIANFVEELRLLTGRGEELNCSRTENSELFWATIGGLGLTGAILSARIRLLPIQTAWIAADYRKADDLDEALDLFAEDSEHRYSVAWIDCLARGSELGRSILIRGDHARQEDLTAPQRDGALELPRRRRRSVPINLPGWTLNPYSVAAFNQVFYERHRDERKLVDYDSFFYPLDSVANWNRIYGRRGFLQYQLVLPTTGSRSGLIEVLDRLSASRMPSFLAVLKMFGKGNEAPLSFPMPGATLALDLPNRGEPLLSLLNELDEIVLKHGGRVYLAKDARLSATAFRAMYPRAVEFERVKRSVDPDGTYSSSLSRRLGLCSESASSTPADCDVAEGEMSELQACGA